ncbi:hypothetical protein RHSIM_Rhsim02G0101100 [Rhododendron simsii]|uniref:Uncharacterized protein n=1 Tax=Rhododendron simsii TaxID=118357 RepID=A0A834H8D2_RHOSS|nr:hypothetical protein RHSIM_Rhsim02G0101100 [Rhododendron simsii]
MEASRGRKVSIDKLSNHVTCNYEEGTEVVSKHLSLAKKEITFMRSACNDGSTSQTQVPVSLRSQYCFKEQLKVRAKGCGKRLKGGKEKTVKKRTNGFAVTEMEMTRQ